MYGLLRFSVQTLAILFTVKSTGVDVNGKNEPEKRSIKIKANMKMVESRFYEYRFFDVFLKNCVNYTKILTMRMCQVLGLYCKNYQECWN